MNNSKIRIKGYQATFVLQVLLIIFAFMFFYASHFVALNYKYDQPMLFFNYEITATHMVDLFLTGGIICIIASLLVSIFIYATRDKNEYAKKLLKRRTR